MILRSPKISVVIICLSFCISSSTYPLTLPGETSQTRSSRHTLEDDVKCVPIRDCSTILKKLSGPTTPEKVRQLQNLTCGFEGSDPKVKCPVHADIVLRTGPISKKSIRPDVTVHPNFHHFPEFEDCGVTSIKIKNYILGGAPASLGAYPWMVRLGYQKIGGDTEFYCAGTLITSRYVLTAAHCVTGGNPAHIPKIARLGEHDSRVDPEFSPELHKFSSVEDIAIEKIIIHPEYDPPTRLHDIALIRLAEEVSFETPWIKPICLPFLPDSFPNLARELGNSTDKWYAEIAGWGKTEKENEGVYVLQQANVPLLSNSECNTIYHGKTTIARSQMCAGGEPGVDSCGGDSGGPLMVFEDHSRRYFQGGIVSFGPSVCGIKGFPGIYTRISSYFTWILDSIER